MIVNPALSLSDPLFDRVESHISLPNFISVGIRLHVITERFAWNVEKNEIVVNINLDVGFSIKVDSMLNISKSFLYFIFVIIFDIT